MLAQPGVDVTLDQRALAIHASCLAVGDAHRTHIQPGRLGKEFPERVARLLDGHAMQIQAGVEGDLSGLELAHLAFLHAIGGPVQFLFCTHIDDELVGQAVDPDRFIDLGGGAAQLVQTGAVTAGLAGIGTVVADSAHARRLGTEKGKVVVLHAGLQ